MNAQKEPGESFDEVLRRELSIENDTDSEPPKTFADLDVDSYDGLDDKLDGS